MGGFNGDDFVKCGTIQYNDEQIDNSWTTGGVCDEYWMCDVQDINLFVGPVNKQSRVPRLYARVQECNTPTQQCTVITQHLPRPRATSQPYLRMASSHV